MLIAFALAAAVLFGGADFLGGAASRHKPTLSVLAVSAPAGAVLLLAAALAAGARLRVAGLPWAAAAGVSGGIGLIIFYRGLAVGPMRLVAPVAALVSTVLPVGVAMAGGERPGPLVYAGGGICLLATVLVSVDGAGAGRPLGQPRAARGLGYGIAAGLAFGIFYLCLRNAGSGRRAVAQRGVPAYRRHDPGRGRRVGGRAARLARSQPGRAGGGGRVRAAGRDGQRLLHPGHPGRPVRHRGRADLPVPGGDRPAGQVRAGRADPAGAAGRAGPGHRGDRGGQYRGGRACGADSCCRTITDDRPAARTPGKGRGKACRKLSRRPGPGSRPGCHRTRSSARRRAGTAGSLPGRPHCGW